MATIEDLRRVYHKLNDVQRLQATSLGRGFKQYGGWTEKQQQLVDFIVDGVDRPHTYVKMDGLNALFDQAASKGAKFPKLVLALNGVDLKLYRAGQHSKTPGAINVVERVRHGDGEGGEYYGKIGTDGRWYPSRTPLKGLVEFLCELADDPAGVASLYGQATGECCFCAKELTDPRSVEVGYGPKCADRWGLPW